MAAVHGLACYALAGLDGWGSNRVTFTDQHEASAGGRPVMAVGRGAVARGPGEVGRAFGEIMKGGFAEVELFVGPATTDQELAWVRSGGFPVHRLTWEEITEHPDWWHEAAGRFYQSSHQLGVRLDQRPA